MNNNDWIKLCDKDFVEIYNNLESLQHFRRLTYFRRQVDLHKFYSVKQWKAIYNLVQSISFRDIDDTNILSGDDVTKVFKQSQKKIIKIREDALLFFGFKTRAKGVSDLKATVKLINAIVGNWCGYIIKSKRKLPYKSSDFITQEEIMIKKLDNSKYVSINPILPSYKPKTNNEIQDPFDSILITNNTTSKYAEHKLFDLSSNAIYEKNLSLEMQIQNQLIDSDKEDPSQGICYDDTIIGEASTVEKKISESLITLCSPPTISLSSEYLIKNESDIDTFVLLLQQKIQISSEKLKQWRTKIVFEMRDNQNYWKKERESINEINFLEYKRNFETKMGVPTTSYKKELKKKSLALIKYA
ncbi:hypothetical protein Glove_669g23 [Diversispora epigaea]|uniref:Uncharacterized protein n=1 Tax=Diversispora epigaea TaxID=1348612 RepID=A0A397G8C1_9GLOM|nr:hypothetical protein Glove_669g23 [Diversispora epigaea]